MTLFTLRNDKRYCLIPLLVYIGVTVFCVIFGLVYEYYSHNVLSYSMLYGFFWPLFGGVVMYGILCIPFFLFKVKYLPSVLTSYCYNAFIATMTVGCYFHGIIEIYGTTNDEHELFYRILGISLAVSAFIFLILSIVFTVSSRKSEAESH